MSIDTVGEHTAMLLARDSYERSVVAPFALTDAEGRVWRAAWIASHDYQRQQPDPVREALVSALRDVTNELQAWHDERPDSPGLRDLCVSCGYLDEARTALALAEVSVSLRRIEGVRAGTGRQGV